jgi:AraC-like DNA-binding protein
MSSKINHSIWALESPLVSPGLWCSSAGNLIGNGNCRYHWFPDYFCPHIIVAGEGCVKVGGKSIHVRAGDMFSIWAGVEIEYSENPENPWEFNWFHLDGSYAEEYTSALGFRKNTPVIRPEQPEKCLQVFRKIHSLIRKPCQQNMYLLLSELYKLPAYTLSQQSVSSAEHDVLTEALTLINSFPGYAMNVNELCETLNVSRVTLFRIFRDKLKKTPIEYIINRRIKIAKKLLCNTEHTVEKIAILSGFNSEKYFIRRFKQTVGQSPGLFRKNNISS